MPLYMRITEAEGDGMIPIVLILGIGILLGWAIFRKK